MIRDFHLNEFVSDCVQPGDTALGIAGTAIEYFCAGESPAEPECQFACLAVCLFLHSQNGGPPATIPLGQLDDLVKFLRTPWTMEGLAKLLANLF